MSITVCSRFLSGGDNYASWADGSDEDIVYMVKKADAGEINLSDYWNVGDERTVHMSAIAANGSWESHAEQDIVLVLMSPEHFTLTSQTTGGRTKCSFAVGMKDCLIEKGVSSLELGNNNYTLRSDSEWFDTSFYNAIPATLRQIFKKHEIYVNNIKCDKYFSYFAEKEVTGKNAQTIGQWGSVGTEVEQLQYYKDNPNFTKHLGPSGAATKWQGRNFIPGTANAATFQTDGVTVTSEWAFRIAVGISAIGCI